MRYRNISIIIHGSTLCMILIAQGKAETIEIPAGASLVHAGLILDRSASSSRAATRYAHILVPHNLPKGFGSLQIVVSVTPPPGRDLPAQIALPELSGKDFVPEPKIGIKNDQTHLSLGYACDNPYLLKIEGMFPEGSRVTSCFLTTAHGLIRPHNPAHPWHIVGEETPAAFSDE